eukprot:g75933.t1
MALRSADPSRYSLGFSPEVWRHFRCYLGRYHELVAVSPELRRFLDRREAWVRLRCAALRLETAAEATAFLAWAGLVWSEAGVRVACLQLGGAALHSMVQQEGQLCLSGLVVDEVDISQNHNSGSLTDQDISALGQAFPHCRALNLSSNPWLTEAILRCWGDLSSLQVLRLARCLKLTGDRALPSMPSLQRLDLSSCRGLTQDTLLQGLHSLRELDLTECSSLWSLANLPPLSNLEILSLNNCAALPQDSLLHLAALSRLRTLDLSFCTQFGAGSLQHLAGLHSLRELRLSHCTGLMAALGHLRELPNLQRLDLSFCSQLTDAALVHLGNLHSLQRLDLSFCSQLTDAALQHLGNLHSLQRLDLSFCSQFTDAAFGCKQLTDAALMHLRKLDSLQWLDLSGCTKLTDAAWGHLGELPRLRQICIRDCSNFTAAGIQKLQATRSQRNLAILGVVQEY